MNSYTEACNAGTQYAAHYVQYLRDNRPFNLLGAIASDIDFNDESRRGYWVGFFSYLEEFIAGAAQHMSPSAHWKLSELFLASAAQAHAYIEEKAAA